MTTHTEQSSSAKPVESPAAAMAELHGGYWSEHPDFPLADWRHEIANDDTRQSYWDWVVSKSEEGGKKARILITLQLDYELNGELPPLASELAESTIEREIENGGFTGDTAMFINAWDLRVRAISED
ncbi:MULTISPECIES: hypothetical protein [unclassified Thioalkalivibrio]|uniref:hypothetical protein n=1 Tax=unclassified Thioalkalivibrio TaxID=2621013 RepID=UPI0003738C4F|nr:MULTISPECIES: hypothetical protein [unclassified Thioalkalivibrio]